MNKMIALFVCLLGDEKGISTQSYNLLLDFLAENKLDSSVMLRIVREVTLKDGRYYFPTEGLQETLESLK